jgi:hypothetical protein
LNLKPHTLYLEPYLFGGHIKLKVFKRRVILDKPEGGFIGADHISTTALALAFFTKVVFGQGVAALAKGFHNQPPIFYLGKKIICLFGGLFLIMMRHNAYSP